MNEYRNLKSLMVVGAAVMGLSLSACGGGDEGPPKPPPPAPPEYADKHMPDGYWNNPEILKEGEAIFTGQQNIDVNCASCHGKNGKPVKAGARDFRRTEQMELYSDSVWFWRVNEGVKGTKMKAWKSKLSEDAIWRSLHLKPHLVSMARNGMWRLINGLRQEQQDQLQLLKSLQLKSLQPRHL